MRKYNIVVFVSFIFLLLVACSPKNEESEIIEEDGYVLKADILNVNEHLDYTNSELNKIYFAGGCFWGVEAYMQRIYGVFAADSGYANGSGENPSYEEVMTGELGFVEAVEVTYDPKRVSLEELINRLFLVIDPTLKDQQGNDIGVQYRTGIYYEDEKEAEIVQAALKQEQDNYDKPIVTEGLTLENFYLAEEFHQDYLLKNPDGYCHIDLNILSGFAIDPIAADEEIVSKLSKE